MTGWRLLPPAALALLVISVLPVLALLGVGLAWLVERDLLLAWMLLAGGVALVSWAGIRLLRRPRDAPEPLRVAPGPDWSTPGRAAWDTVEEIATRVRNEARASDALLQIDALWDLSCEVVEAVARRMYADADHAVLEVRVPDALRAVEHLAVDLREAVETSVPGSHLITIGDVLRGQRLIAHGTLLYRLYRIVAFGVDPISSAVRELRGLAAGGLMDASLSELRGWLLDAYVKKVGYHAIELYGREQVATPGAVRRHVTAASSRDLDQDATVASRLVEEPLRVLVVGQVNAGKSSLINALFDEPRAAVDVVPLTAGVEAYVLDRDDVERAIVLDTAGHAGPDGRDPLRQAAEAIRASDLVILACSATSAARGPDRELLDRLAEVFQRATGEPTVTLAVLTHIDQLRPFREWQPPYDVARPERPKAASIRQAMEAVARDLDLPLERVVPVCLAPDRRYNVEEGLVPAILGQLDGARRLRYLRCRRDVRDAERWARLLDQARAAGRLLARQGPGWVAAVARDRSSGAR